MDRRTFLGAAAAAAPLIASAKKQQLNLLFIMSDQHQREASGCYGSSEVHTPHIDEIARRGVRLDNAYCAAPVCVPSRGSIITGTFAHSHGAKTLQDPLPASIRTVGHFFKERGYATGAVGKMHFVDETRQHGFDYRLHLDDFYKTLSPEDRVHLRKDQGAAEDVNGRPSSLPARFFQDHYYAEKTVEFLHQNRNRPFCLWSSFYMPHTPLVPLREFWDLYKPSSLELPERSATELQDGFPGNLIRAQERGWYSQTDDALRRSLAGYYGNISQTDACVGRVYNALRELGLDKNTVVVYTSDHGEMAGAHRMWTKHNMYEQSVAVPLVVSMPDRIQAGSSRKQLISQVDLFPTLAALCGHEVPKGLPGRDFSALVTNKRHSPREYVYSEYYFCKSVFTRDNRYFGRSPIQMVRTDRWKLNYLEWDRSELFDMSNDPHEFRNCIDDPANASVLRELTGIIRREHNA
jgi:choline-sulfatase